MGVDDYFFTKNFRVLIFGIYVNVIGTLKAYNPLLELLPLVSRLSSKRVSVQKKIFMDFEKSVEKLPKK